MADTTQQAQPSGEQPQPAAEPGNSAPQEPSQPDTNELSHSDFDVSLPPIDKTLPEHDSPLPAMDASLPPMDSTIPALPPIDTSLPPLDTTMPAIDELHGSDANFFARFGGDGAGDGGAENGTTTHDIHTTEDHGPLSTPAPQDSAPSNGVHTQPGQQHQHFDQQPPQHHYSPHQNAPTQPPGQMQHQSQQQSQQPRDMYNSHQSASPPINNHSMQGQPSHIPQAPIGSPMPPMASVSQYMAGYPSQMGMNSGQMHYQLQGDANKMLSSRHKKEVKRRTKTGCLTCRKRRIKCDEGHPVCRNCVKSKRECLGYDPVFKQPTPSAIQPAPNPQPSLVVNPQEPSPAQQQQQQHQQQQQPSYPAAPPGYVPASSQPYNPSQSPSTSTERYDYNTSIDPSLNQNNSPDMASVQNVVDGGLQPTINPTTTTTGHSEPTSFRLKQVSISDLLALRGIPPPPPHPITALPPNRLEEIQAVFLATYAPAIDKFFETRWFSEKALSHLLANAQLMAEYSALIEAFSGNLNDPNVLARLESFEASVVWSTMTLCRHVVNVSNGSQQDYDLLATSKRLDVIEAMITGDHLDSNPLAQFPTREPASNPPSLPDQLTQRQLDFWSAIGYFLTLHDNEASAAKEIDDTLGRCRSLLDICENRDVIYSIAIARHLGQRWADFPHNFPQPITTNEKDAGAKLYVAQKFLEQEAGGKGTTQVIKRLCGMVVRSWFVSRE
ncbi:putative C6 finger domain protein [Aspergillus stella-maris]|uniref:putative C6 finger domain protein n=1 Tax=Aspergillus stella-maris TaxID=1810926 RepID=UPI003CCCDBB8